MLISSVHPDLFLLVNSVSETHCCYARESYVRNAVTLGRQWTCGAIRRLVPIFVFLVLFRGNVGNVWVSLGAARDCTLYAVSDDVMCCLGYLLWYLNGGWAPVLSVVCSQHSSVIHVESCYHRIQSCILSLIVKIIHPESPCHGHHYL
jgi:hypothetical protein